MKRSLLVRCPACNNAIFDSFNFCPNCGLAFPGAQVFADDGSYSAWKERVGRHKEAYAKKMTTLSFPKHTSAVPSKNYKKLNVGDEFYFGTFNGKKILWKTIRIKDHMAFIICSRNLCNMPYHRPGGSVTWKDCTLRKWLNNEFFNNSFTPSERAKILPCKLKNRNNPQYRTPGGEQTTDKVFLLSIHEAYTLFPDDKARANGAWWWLRSPGCGPFFAAFIVSDGRICTYGFNSNERSNYGVRPALWINLEL